MAWLTDPQIWLALVTLSALEIVLGIDNIIFISIQAAVFEIKCFFRFFLDAIRSDSAS